MDTRRGQLMYHRCIYCRGSLGENRAIAHFPVGRRVAFDTERGRLWAICESCGRWNLAPIEERWEAIEECDALFRRSSLRVRSGNVGVARVTGTPDLVRVGPASHSEFAGWRYGPRLRRRRSRALLTTTVLALVGSVAALSVGALIVGLATIVGTVALAPVLLGWEWLEHWFDDRVVAVVHPPDGHARKLLEHHIGAIELLPASGGEPWGVSVPHRSGTIRVRGTTAKQLLGQLLARLHRRGASKRQVADAVEMIVQVGDTEQFIAWAVQAREERRRSGGAFHDAALGAFALSDTERLALEMAVNEDAERAALEGDVEALRSAWRDAEEVAAIADDLLVPDRVRRMLARLRRHLPEGEALRETDA